jgi:hypothetical protein
VKCETDCSGLVTVCCIYAGIPESALTYKGNCATTSTLKNMLKNTGEVDIYTSAQYTRKTDRLKRGDILLSEGHHVVVVVKADNVPKKSIHDVAMDCINGKYGVGAERKSRLLAEGYNYSEVQNEINAIMNASQKRSTESVIWDFLMSKIGNAYGVAGMMGNLKAESNLNPKNLQNSCEKRLGMTDDSYTYAVDTGAYTNFANDSAGYGLAQWTSSGRKAGLLNSRGNRSIGDLNVQLDFLWSELSAPYRNVLNGLKTAKSVREASDIVLTKFERPKDQSEAVKQKRTSYGNEFYKMYGC